MGVNVKLTSSDTMMAEAKIEVTKPVQEPPKVEVPQPPKPVFEEPVKPPQPPVVEKTPEEPQEDPEILRRLVHDISYGKYSEKELEKPAFLRQNVVLFQKPNSPDDVFIQILLDKHKR